MILALPDTGSSLEDFLDNELPNFEKWSGEMEQRPGSLEIPRFKLEDDLKLNETLIALGIPSVFDRDRAELKLNRPFFFAITDRTTGLIVFMDEVGNPLES